VIGRGIFPWFSGASHGAGTDSAGQALLAADHVPGPLRPNPRRLLTRRACATAASQLPSAAFGKTRAICCGKMSCSQP
jgi:hypothetical protein